METPKTKETTIGITCPMLTKSNYMAWSIKMKAYMDAHGVWLAIEPKDPKVPVDEKTDKIALAAIYQGIPEDILLSIADKKSAKEVWEAIKLLCFGADRVKQARAQTLKSEFETLSMKESKKLDDFCMRLKGLVTNLRALGETMEESYVVKKLLRAIPRDSGKLPQQLSNLGTLKRCPLKKRLDL
ncbi:hypothetical protein AgCh_025572 [Apium graveolens]